jgi:hypothetical protein
MRYAVSGQVLFRDFGCLRDSGLEFGALSAMEDLGIIGPMDPSLGREWKIEQRGGSGFSADLKFSGRLLLDVRSPNPEATLKLPSIYLTRVGKDLFKVGRFDDPPETYINRIVSELLPFFSLRLLERTVDGNGIAIDTLIETYEN